MLRGRSQVLMEGAALVAMGDNRSFRGDAGLMLGIDPFKVALEYASGRSASVIGKPAPAFFLAGCARRGPVPAAVTMIGDDAEADVAAALASTAASCAPANSRRAMPPGARGRRCAPISAMRSTTLCGTATAA